MDNNKENFNIIFNALNKIPKKTLTKTAVEFGARDGLNTIIYPLINEHQFKAVLIEADPS